MEIFYFNSSSVYIHKLSNSSGGGGGITPYEQCKDMPAALIFYLTLQSINLFLGIPANLMVLWLLHKNKRDSSTSDIFILHLAILDTVFCLLPPLELVNQVFLTITSAWHVLLFFYGVKDSSLLFLSCICMDRYMAVLHPITFTELKDRNHRVVCASALWLFTLTYAAAKGVNSIPHFEKLFIAMILAAFAFMLFCNAAILNALRKSGPGRDEMHPVKKRAFKMVLIILAIIVCNYFPPVVVFPFKEHFSQDVFHCYIKFVAFGCMDISSSIQPLLYLSREIPSFQCCCRKDQDSGKSTGPC
ncbi:proteinase-activated receptor 3-like [Anguilla anguilla]|uniref:proteinase-activated receptor 3-like n=1 Tax=Anguilla anguilla TaxID=7936 RepID=UPI0015B0C8C6|nr:proteinase-activated receptor 3-like [Anguilla anguilla]